MQDIKPIVSKNISTLRQYNDMTQAELAAALNYSDKAVSKWERAESLPDVAVLKEMAELFSVSVDYLLEEHPNEKRPPRRFNTKNRIFITGICILAVALLATLCFVITDFFFDNTLNFWLVYVYAVPVSFIIWLIFSCVWFNKNLVFLIISLLLWSVLASVYLTCLPFGVNYWLLFIIGVPAQGIIILWSRIGTKK